MLNICTKCGYVQRELVCLSLPTSIVNNNNTFFICGGYLKDNVYENNPQTIGELKAKERSSIG